jgi:hypothetical protein
MMRNLRILLLSGSGLLLVACAAQTIRPDQTPEYEIIWSPTPFYEYGPTQRGGPSALLSTKTRVKLLRKKKGYSLVQLEDSRTGYVANQNMEAVPPESQKRPVGAPAAEESQARSIRKKPASASPLPQEGQVNEAPASEATAPPPDLQPTPKEVPSPTPLPEPPLEKPKFRL